MACSFCAVTPVSPCPMCEVAPTSTPAPIRKARAKRPVRPAGVPRVASPAVTPTPPAVVAPVTAQAYRAGPLVLVCSGCGVRYESKHVRDVCDACLAATPPAESYPTVRKVCAESEGYTPTHNLADRAAFAIQQAFKAGQITIAVALMVGLGDPEQREVRLSVLKGIDENAAVRGYLSDRDETLRERIIEEACSEAKARLGYDPRWIRPAPVSLPWEHRAVLPGPVTPPAKVVTFTPPMLRNGDLMPGDWSALDLQVKAGTLSTEKAQEIAALWMRQTGKA